MRTLMSLEDFSKILKNVETYSQCDQSLIDKYKNKLPELLINTWVQYGLQNFEHGFLWTVNPDNYLYLTELFFKEHDPSNSHVIMRTAFGDFIFIHKNQIFSYSVVTSLLLKVGNDFESFINFSLSFKSSLNDGYFFNIFKKALNKLGPINEEEIYAYSPALQLGGEMKTDNLIKQNMKTYMMMLSGLDN